MISESGDRVATLDSLFEAFTANRRRYVLYYLYQSGGAVEVAELAAWIEELEREKTGVALSDDQYERIVTDLHHCHLPMLDDAGLIDYDSRSGMLRVFEHADRLAELIRFTSALERVE